MQPHRFAVSKLGLRGMSLLLLGVVWVLLSIGIWQSIPATPTGVGLWHVRVPLVLRVAEWLLPGVFALVAVRWQHLSNIALGLLTIGPLVRLTSYAGAFIQAALPGGGPGLATGWHTALIYLALLGFLLLAAATPIGTGSTLSQLQEKLAAQMREQGVGG